MVRRLLEKVPLRAQLREQGRHHLFAYGVERRIGHLGEELPKVVVQEARLVRKHGERGIVSHRAQGFFPVQPHGLHEQALVFQRVAEHFLPDMKFLGSIARRAAVIRQILQAHGVIPQPFAVRTAGSKRLLDFLVLDDPAFFQIDQKHLAGLQTPLCHHVGRIRIEHARFGGKNNQPVLGNRIPRGPQAIPVQNRANVPPIRKRQHGRAVPRLHQTGMIFVKIPLLFAHLPGVFPGFRHQHHHCVRKRAPRKVEQFERIVENGRIADALGQDGQQLLHIVAEEFRFEQRLAGVHPVEIAPKRIDLAIVAQKAKRLRQRPLRQRVRREPRMHHSQRAFHARIDQVRIETGQILAQQHPLVDERAGRERANVKRAGLGHVGLRHGMFDHLPDNVQLALERFLVRRLFAAPHQRLPEFRLHGRRRLPRGIRANRDAAPPDPLLPFRPDGFFHRAAAKRLRPRVPRQKNHAGRICPRRPRARAQVLQRLRQKGVRRLNQDARAVARPVVASAGRAVRQVVQHFEPFLHNIVARFVLHRANETDAACVMLVKRVVKAFSNR